MATAEELLATMSASETEPHIVIGRDRVITVPNELKAIAVQFDHDIETVIFDCPRYWDEHDFLGMNIYVNYRTPEGTIARYPVQNVRTDLEDSSIIHFTWTISNHLTQTKGKISFLVCAYITDQDGNEQNHWNSRLNQDLEVLEGLECNNDAVIEQYPDILESVLARLTRVERGYDPTELVNLHIWKQYYGSGTIAKRELSYAYILGKTGVTGYYPDTINVSDGAEASNGVISLSQPILSIGDNDLTVNSIAANIHGRYIYSNYAGKYYYVPSDAAVTQRVIVTDHTEIYIEVSPIYELCTGSGFSQYVAAIERDAYPDSGEHTDGFIYEYYKILAEGSGDGSSSSGSSSGSNVALPEDAMSANVYDPQGKQTDIFQYVDDKVAESGGNSGETTEEPAVTAIDMVRDDSTITITYTMDDDSTSVDTLALDENGYPTNLNVDGTDVPITLSGFTTETGGSSVSVTQTDDILEVT